MAAVSLNSITIRKTDDWHVHLRDSALMWNVLPYTAQQFARAVVMPNLPDPITTVKKALEYRKKILRALADHSITGFTPLMTLYATNGMDPDEIDRAVDSGFVHAVKLYPAHATTGSAHGVIDVMAPHMMRVYERMALRKIPLLLHGEVTDPAVDIFDREAVFIEQILDPLRQRLPGLPIVLEHITTQEAAEYVEACYMRGIPNLAATITPHHLIINRNAIFAGGIRPHLYCLPIAKREKHRLALRRAATSGLPCFFLGTDSAPHALKTKEAECGCAGIFNAAGAVEMYAEVFEEEGALETFEAFASLNGPAFYGLPPNEKRITLERVAAEWVNRVPALIGRDEDTKVVPFRAGEALRWRVAA